MAEEVKPEKLAGPVTWGLAPYRPDGKLSPPERQECSRCGALVAGLVLGYLCVACRRQLWGGR